MLKGKAWKYGDDVDTDVIIPARHLTSSDPESLKAHVMEDIDPGFSGKVGQGDVIVAGKNFGCGSSREHAPIAIKAAGVSCVIAKSFARIFFRNSFNIGLPIVESAEAVDNIEPGDEVQVDLAEGHIMNITKGTEYVARPLPPFMQELVAEGGLMEHVKKMMAEGGIAVPASAAENGDEEQLETMKKPGARMEELEREARPVGKDAPWVEEEEQAKPPAAENEDNDAEEDDEED